MEIKPKGILQYGDLWFTVNKQLGPNFLVTYKPSMSRSLEVMLSFTTPDVFNTPSWAAVSWKLTKKDIYHISNALLQEPEDFDNPNGYTIWNWLCFYQNLYGFWQDQFWDEYIITNPPFDDIPYHMDLFMQNKFYDTTGKYINSSQRIPDWQPCKHKGSFHKSLYIPFYNVLESITKHTVVKPYQIINWINGKFQNGMQGSNYFKRVIHDLQGWDIYIPHNSEYMRWPYKPYMLVYKPDVQQFCYLDLMDNKMNAYHPAYLHYKILCMDDNEYMVADGERLMTLPYHIDLEFRNCLSMDCDPTLMSIECSWWDEEHQFNITVWDLILYEWNRAYNFTETGMRDKKESTYRAAERYFAGEYDWIFEENKRSYVPRDTPIPIWFIDDKDVKLADKLIKKYNKIDMREEVLNKYFESHHLPSSYNNIHNNSKMIPSWFTDEEKELFQLYRYDYGHPGEEFATYEGFYKWLRKKENKYVKRSKKRSGWFKRR